MNIRTVVCLTVVLIVVLTSGSVAFSTLQDEARLRELLEEPGTEDQVIELLTGIVEELCKEQKYARALECIEEVDTAVKDEWYSLIIRSKKAIVYEGQKKYAEAISVLEEACDEMRSLLGDELEENEIGSLMYSSFQGMIWDTKLRQRGG